MIQINPKIVSELKNCKGFGFETKTNTKDSKKLSYRSLEDQLNQNRLIGEIQAVISQLQALPCDASITVGVENGHQVMTGEIYAYDQSSMDRVEHILKQADLLTHNFVQIFTSASYLLKISQSVTITKVYRKKDFLDS